MKRGDWLLGKRSSIVSSTNTSTQHGLASTPGVGREAKEGKFGLFYNIVPSVPNES